MTIFWDNNTYSTISAGRQTGENPYTGVNFLLTAVWIEKILLKKAENAQDEA